MAVSLAVGTSDSRRKEFKCTSLPNQVHLRLFGLICHHLACLMFGNEDWLLDLKLERRTFCVEETQGYPIIIFNVLIVIIALFLSVT